MNEHTNHQHRPVMEDHSGHHSSNGHSMHGMTGHNPHVFRFFTTSPMLFKAWPTSTITGLVLAMVATAAFAFAYEGLRYYVYVHSAFEKRKQRCPKAARKYDLMSRITGSFLHMLHFFTGYILMLAVMTYNAWIFVCLILGATLGCFFIRPMVEHHFRKIRGDPITRETKRLLSKCGTANGGVKEVTTYDFKVNNNATKENNGVKTNGSIVSCKSEDRRQDVLYFGAKEKLSTEDRVSVV